MSFEEWWNAPEQSALRDQGNKGSASEGWWGGYSVGSNDAVILGAEKIRTEAYRQGYDRGVMDERGADAI